MKTNIKFKNMKKNILFTLSLIFLVFISCLGQYTNLLDFTGTTNGSYPYYSSLVSDSNFLYGMTENGGTNSKGVIFKIKQDGTSYVKLFDFAGANGSYPLGSLISNGTFLYGMTTYGGTSTNCTDGCGTIFKIKTDGTGYVKLLDFAGISNGSKPYGSLAYDGVFLYGMTENGGTNNKGVIFKIKQDGTGYVKLFDFAGANGSYPWGSLTYDGNFLYGMTTTGGTSTNCTNGCGTIFKIKTDGTDYTKLFNFEGISDGKNPYGSLTSDGNFFYGMTSFYVSTIFKIKQDGTGYSKLFDISHSLGSLIYESGFLYGMTMSGGTNAMGSVFKFYTLVIDSVNSTMVSCNGGSNGTATVNISGGLPPYTYLWSNGDTTSQATNLTSQMYSVTVTDANNMTKIATVTITQPTALSVTIYIPLDSCNINYGIAIANVNGGIPPYSFSWSTLPIQTNETATNLSSGNYTVTITDTNGCIEIANCTVNANSGANFNYTVNNMTVNFTMLNQTGCISNGFLWDYGNGMSSIIATAPYTTYSNSGTYTACLQCDTLPSACIVCANITVPGNYSGSTLRINEIDNKYGISISPNPTKGNFTILITSLKLLNSQLSICNILGDIIYQSVITNIKSEIDLSSQLSGVYIVNISADYKTYHQKLLKE